MTLYDGESLPVSSKPSTLPAQNPTYDLRLSLETQNGLQLNLTSEDPAVDSGLEVVSLLE